MRVKLKTLKNVVVDLDLPTDTSVQKIKEAGAASEHGKSEGWDPEGMKLIYQGKIMDNAKDMASYNVTEDDFMVVMAAKAKKPAASEAAPAAAAAAAAIAATSPSPEPAASPAPASAPAAPAPATAPAAPAPAPTPAPAPAPAAEQQLLPEHEASVSNLCDMGFPRDAVMAAMRAAYMNADRAVEYLTNGIPEELQGGGGATAGDDEDMDDAPETPATWELLAASPAFRAEIGGVRDQARPPCPARPRAPPRAAPHPPPRPARSRAARPRTPHACAPGALPYTPRLC
jgi:UV excision repair protein Rad23